MAMHDSDTQEVIGRLRGFLHATLEGVAHGADATSKSVSLAAYFVRLRKRLSGAQRLLRDNEGVEDDERILREAQILFVRRRDQFHTGSRTDLVRAWNDLLADATEKVYRDRVHAAAFESDAALHDREDQEFYAAARRIAGRP